MLTPWPFKPLVKQFSFSVTVVPETEIDPETPVEAFIPQVPPIPPAPAEAEFQLEKTGTL